jgi:UDP-N-acetylmuramate--alanine ligase
MVPVFGRHMALNATACTIVCLNLGITVDKIKELLKEFKNAERRFQEEKVGNSIIIDDYAHHPTEIKVTLEAAKAKYPDKDIVAIFKPNTYSRTKEFTEDFATALDIADYAYITNVDSNREKQEDYPGINSNLILDKMKKGKLLIESDISDLLTHKDNVFVFMSCASISHLKEDLISELLK